MRSLAAAALGRVLLACSSALGLVAALAHQAQARVDPITPTLEQSRARLDERMARARDLLGRHDAAPPGAGGDQRMAQWPNWPNYWSNWPNWRNFR